MKTIFFFTALIFTVVSSLAQGTVNFNNNVPGSVVSHVYWGYGPRKEGNGPNDLPQGPADYTGYTPLAGLGWSAQLWAANGVVPDPDAPSLQSAYPITTFRTGVEAGFVEPVTATLSGVPGDAPTASVQLRVWDNEGGTINDWNSAGD